MQQVLYNTIGVGYDVSRKADTYIADRLFALLAPVEGHRYLDIGCGTGNYTTALFRKGVPIFGVDPSETMLNEARTKAPDLEWTQGTAETIPFPDQHFAGGIATLTIHHWTDLTQSFHELARVFQPGARLVIYTSLPEQTAGYWLAHYFPQMMQRSVDPMPRLDVITTAATSAGFTLTQTEKYAVRPDVQDLFLYSGKHHPQLYFNPDIRKNISSFAALANAEEVESGLITLENDLGSGHFEKVKAQYAHDLGDYMFVVLEKH